MAMWTGPAPATQTPHRVTYRRLDLSAGEFAGCGRSADGLVVTAPQGRYEYADIHGDQVPRSYEYGTWIGPLQAAPFPFSQLVPSWAADTPAGTWIEICLRVRRTGGRSYSRWFVAARWSSPAGAISSTSLPHQSDPMGWFDVDTLRVTQGVSADLWQLRITLLREVGSQATPVLRYAGGMISAGTPDLDTTSKPGPYAGKILDVPAMSQRVHAGQYPNWAGGGDAWCSPTAVSMILAYWGTGPTPDRYAWVKEGPDRQVPYAAQHCFDHAYGAGNWSFNAAYAAGFGLEAFVTRLRDLTEVEEFAAAGIPLVASLPVAPERLDGAGYRSDGHLMVLAGCTDDGYVMVNDPAAPTAADVPRRYRRDQFERAWLGGNGGLVYVIHPPSVPLPAARPDGNW